MSTLSIPQVEDQEAFNIERWLEVCADPELAKLEHRIETDRFGKVTMSPPPGFNHGNLQSQIAFHLRSCKPEGTAVTECPISTREGIKAADIAWISKERTERSLKKNILTIAPEICVEVLSPSNSKNEIELKKDLYFEAGADEVWICDLQGKMYFFLNEANQPSRESALFTDFPNSLES